MPASRFGRKLYSSDEWNLISHRLALSQQELRIAQAVLDDAHEGAIAEALGISSHTVHTHLERLYRKLQVKSRVELVVRIAACHLQICQEVDSPAAPL
ncbi:MAG: helix-turn-helix transcriptional regulator [Pirellulales bacterium]|nr:helix-turn-helix transcriptional regulator [Pirellulales bacterium]